MKKIFKISTLLLASLLSIESCGTKNSNSTTEDSTNNVDNSFTNGGFELGNLNGWTTTGMAFSDDDVSDASNIGNSESNKTGVYFFNGDKSSLASAKGTLSSGYFRVDGTSFFSYKIGAAKDQSKIFIQFFEEGSDTPLSFKANGGDEALTQIGNVDFNEASCNDTLITNYIDLSDYTGKNVKVVVTDNDTNNNENGSDYSYVNLDDFKVITTNISLEIVKSQREAELEKYSDNFEEDPTSTTLRNGGFETGDFTGWKVISGNAFDQSGIIDSSSTFWGERVYHGNGDKIFSGEGKSNSTVGKMRSEKFTIEDDEGSKFVSFRLGAAKRSTCYVALCDASTDEELVKVTNEQLFSDPAASLNMFLHVIDVTQYKGKVLYFLIVDADRGESDFAFMTFDDFRINLTEDEVKELIAEEKNYDSYSDLDKTTYNDMYSSKLSFPLAGEAPVINLDGLDNEYIATTFIKNEGTYNFLSMLETIKQAKVSGSTKRISDDYTAFNDLSISIESVQLNGGDPITENLDSIDVSEVGNYVINFKIADAFNQTTQGKALVEATSDEPVIPTTITNGDFETGDLTGWTASGEAFIDEEVISSSNKFWGSRDFHGEGNYLFDGETKEGSTGELRSSTFKIDDSDGDKYISFLLGAAANKDNTYVAICDADDDSELIRITNDYFKDAEISLNMVRHYLNVTQYKGRNVYIKIVDNATSGFGFLTFDDFKVNLSADEVKELYTNTKAESNYVNDSVAKDYYTNIYQNQISLDQAGNAPVIQKDDETSDIAFTYDLHGVNSSFDLTSLNDEIKKHVSDDFTAKNDLTIDITSLKKPDSTEITTGFDNVDMSAAGTYEVGFKVTDKFNQSTTGKFDIEVILAMPFTITNGDFETGDMTDWTVLSGTFNMNNAVMSDSTFWNEKIPFNKGGTYFLNGWNAGAESDVYEVKSSTFNLGGSGYISFKMGGRAAVLNVYDATTDTKVASYRNTGFVDNGVLVSSGSRLATMITYVADLHTYLGKDLYITIQDDQTSNWGVAFFDDINTYYENAIDVTNLKDVVTQPENGVDVETEILWMVATNTITVDNSSKQD